MTGCAQVSCDAYRDVVRKNSQFIEFFQAVTPVQELGRMNIGSRPAKRKAAGSIDDLRAIPWIFAWTQIRFHLPVWLGIGQAFEVLLGIHCNHLSCLEGPTRNSPAHMAGQRAGLGPLQGIPVG